MLSDIQNQLWSCQHLGFNIFDKSLRQIKDNFNEEWGQEMDMTTIRHVGIAIAGSNEVIHINDPGDEISAIDCICQC